MTDDQFEDRLRRALHARADREVDAAAPLPPIRRPDGRWGGRPPYLLPLLAAAVVVLAAGGTVVAARSVGHAEHAARPANLHPSTVAPNSLDLGGTGTAELPTATPNPTTTVPPSRTRSATATPVSTTPTTAPPTASSSTRYVPPPPPSTGAAPTSGPNVPCRGDQLALSVGGDRQVPGNPHVNDYDFVYVINTGGTCELTGYPSVVAYDRNGRVTGRATQLADPAPVTVVLHHGDRAEIDVYDRYTSSAACQGDVQGSLVVTPPASATSATITGWQYSACNLAVTSFQPARSAGQHS